MTAMPPAPMAPARSWSTGRVVALVLGVLLLVPALGVLVGGGALLWADTAGRTDDGYVMSGTDRFGTDGHVLVTERIDLSTGADWLPFSAALGTARVEVTGISPSRDVFVGVAPAADAERYLDGVSGTVIDDLGFGDQAPNQHLIRGGDPSGPPGAQDFWTSQTSGPGVQRLSWSPADGDWMLVIMNADGSADLAVDAQIGATVPALTGLAWGVLLAGAILTLVAGLLITLAVRRPAGRPDASYGYPAAAPPPWTPPMPTDRTTAADAAPDPARSDHLP